MISFTNTTKLKITGKVFHRVAKILYKGENILKEKVISVVLVNKEEISDLNKEYREKEGATDVLSFGGEGELLGEIVICPEIVKENAKEDKKPFRQELVFVFIHGVLHLCGYDHEKSKLEAARMQAKENYYLSKIRL